MQTLCPQVSWSAPGCSSTELHSNWLARNPIRTRLPAPQRYFFFFLSLPLCLREDTVTWRAYQNIWRLKNVFLCPQDIQILSYKTSHQSKCGSGHHLPWNQLWILFKAESLQGLQRPCSSYLLPEAALLSFNPSLSPFFSSGFTPSTPGMLVTFAGCLQAPFSQVGLCRTYPPAHGDCVISARAHPGRSVQR